MNFPTLFKIIPEPFGLDLSDRSFKIAEVSGKRGKFVLKNLGMQSIEEGLMQDGEIHSEEKLARAIREGLDTLKNGRPRSPYVACSLPEQKTFLRVVQLPRMKKEEIQEAIQWEIEANIPLSLTDVYFDWRIIPSPHKSVRHFDILISAAPRDLVDSYTELLLKAGLKPLSFEPESVALARCVIASGVSEKPVLIVDLGRMRTSFVIYAGSGIRFSSSTQISGDLITENIARELKISREEAEDLKREVGFSASNKKVFEAIIPALTDLKQQIAKYIAFYTEHAEHIHDGAFKIDTILLSGEGARLKGIGTYLASSLKLQATIADPFANVLSPESETTVKGSPTKFIRYTTALGLALPSVQY